MLVKEKYIDKVSELRSSLLMDQAEFYKSKFFGQYMMISTSLTTFLPKIQNDRHLDLAREILFNQTLSYIDQFYPELLKKFTINDQNSLIANSENEGTIFVTYHTGSYRLFLHHLASKKVPFCLVVQQKYIDDHDETTQQLFKRMSGNQDQKLDVISSEEPRLLLHLRNKLKQGISVVFYIDGNTGVALNENKEKNNLTKIEFLDYHIYARQGIAFLACLTKAPLVSVLSKRISETSSSLEIKKVTTAIPYEEKEDFIREITKKLYAELELFIKKHPEQWEGWLYLTNFCEISAQKKTNLVFGNSENSVYVSIGDYTELYISDDKFFLVQKNELKIMEINEEKFQFIENFKKKQLLTPLEIFQVKGKNYSWNFIDQMVGMNILKIA